MQLKLYFLFFFQFLKMDGSSSLINLMEELQENLTAELKQTRCSDTAAGRSSLGFILLPMDIKKKKKKKKLQIVPRLTCFMCDVIFPLLSTDALLPCDSGN